MEKIIYSKKLALYLRKQGFELLRTDINENFPQFNVFIFKDSPDMQRAINNYSKD